MASFPTSPHTFTNFSNGALSDAAQVTDIYGEVEAIEAGLLNGTARLNSSNSTVANLSVTGGSTFSGLHVGSTASFGSSVTISSGGLTVSSGGLVVSTGALTIGQGQIVFPATQVAAAGANTLDDYEENTWVPTDASGAGLSITNNGSGYIKVGQLVTVWTYLTYPATADGTNSLIGGLPYACSATLYGTAVVGWTDSATALGAHIPTNTTTIEFNTITAVTRRTNAQMTTISVRLTISYRAAA